MNVRNSVALLSLGLFVIPLLGCDPSSPVNGQSGVNQNSSSPPKPPPPPEAFPAETAPQAGDVNPMDRAGVDLPDLAAEATPAAQPIDSPAGPTSLAAKPTIRLSAGLALPQTLPDGTRVGVSVDYKVTGDLNTAAKYLWIVQSQKGETEMEVQLKQQGGNLSSFLPIEVRPDDGPFKTRIEEISPGGGRALVSNVEPLK